MTLNKPSNAEPSGMHCFVFGSATLGGHEMMAAKIVAEVVAFTGRARVLAAAAQIERLRSVLPTSIELFPLEHAEGQLESLRGFLNPSVYSAAAELARKTKGCSIVVAVNGGLPANHSLTLGLALARRRNQFRLVVYYPMVHSTNELSLPRLRAFSYQRARNRVIRLVDSFITIDDVWSQRLCQMADRPLDVAVVHNYVDPASLKQAIAPADAPRYKICLVGRHDRFQKGLDLFAQVASHLANGSDTPAIEFGIIGSGPDNDDLRSRCAKIANDRVSFVFHGWQSHPEALIAAHHALVLPSRLEGVPTVVVESLMMGLRVFAFDIPGATCLLAGTSLVPAFNTTEMARRIAIEARRRKPAAPCNDYVRMLGDRERFTAEIRAALCQ